MSDTSEVMNVLESAIYDVLAATSGVTDVVGTNIVRGLAQMYSGHPIVVYALVSGGQVNKNPVERLDLLYEARCVSTVGVAEAASVGGAIEDALNGVELTVAGWFNIDTQVEDFFVWSEFRIQPAFEAWHNGRFIRIRLSKT